MSVKLGPVWRVRTVLVASAGFDVARGPLPRDSWDNTLTFWEAIPGPLRAEAEPFSDTHSSIEASGLTHCSTQWDCQGHRCPDFNSRGPQGQLVGNQISKALLCLHSSRSQRSVSSPEASRQHARSHRRPRCRGADGTDSLLSGQAAGGEKRADGSMGSHAAAPTAGYWRPDFFFCYPIGFGPQDPAGDSGLSCSSPSSSSLVNYALRSLSPQIFLHD